MRFILISFQMLFLMTTTSAQPEKIKQDFHSLSWLEGKWTRLNIVKPGRTAFEEWKKTGDLELTGIGVTLQDGDTLFVEKLKILVVKNEIHYVAIVPENPEPVHFAFTQLSAKQFTCENQHHDYPKRISYQLNGSTLIAQTSGDGNVQEFTFIKTEK